MFFSTVTYQTGKVATVIVMLFALLWLSISTPFVYAAQQLSLTENGATKSDAAPFAGVEEEKSSVSLLQEYLHEEKPVTHFFTVPLLFEKCHQCDEYLAYHPDPHCPPPNMLA